MTFTKNGKKRLDEVSAPIERSTEQRPKGQAIFVRQIYSFKKFTIARLIAVGLSALLLPSIAQAEPDTEKPYLLPEIIIQSLRGDPTVGRSAALSCQAIFSLGQRRAERKVQLSATIDGERELRAERDELIRNFNSDSNRLLNEIEKRTSEMLIINERLDDLTTRYESLMALLGNSLVSRLELVRLMSQIADTKIEQTRAHWQQENSYLQAVWLSDSLIQVLGIPTGDNAC